MSLYHSCLVQEQGLAGCLYVATSSAACRSSFFSRKPDQPKKITICIQNNSPGDDKKAYSYQAPGKLFIDGASESNTECGNDANTRTESCSAALWERHMGEHRRRRPTLPRQRRLGVARDPMKLRRSSFGAASVITGETQATNSQRARPCKSGVA